MSNAFELCQQRLVDRGMVLIGNNPDGEIWKLGSDLFLLFFTIDTNIQVKSLDTINKILKNCKISNGIKLFTDSTSASVKNTIGDNVELICTKELQCNIMRHIFQPQMQKCSKTQAKNAIRLHLYAPPQFTSDDAVVKWMNWKKGDVIAICKNKCGNTLGQDGRCCQTCNFRIVV